MYHIILIFLFPFIAFAQSNFRGSVLSAKTNQPLSGASVYFNNTSIGTSTNVKGEFAFSSTDIFNAELIISSVGYEPLVYKIPADADFTKNYTFKLAEKEALLQDVLILTKDARKKYLQLFRENFLGLTEEASQSKIANEDAIYFTKEGDEKWSFNAHADTPLVIINKMLGYKISFDLQKFFYSSKSTLFYGYTRYEELGTKNKYVKNRRKAYYGSTLHFYRSLIHNQLKEEAYQLFIVKDDTIKVSSPVSPNITISKNVSTAYPINAAQIIRKDTGSIFYRAIFAKKLMVQYDKNPASKGYLSQHVFLNEVLPRGFRSYIQLNEVKELWIDGDGILQDPLSVLYGGYWIYEKAANLLPFNYYPEK